MSRPYHGVMPIGEAEYSLEAPPASPAMRRASAGFLRPVLGRLADLLPPPVCIVCRKSVGGHGLLCAACFATIDFITPPLCARLGVPLPYEAGEPLLSAAAIAAPPVYDHACAAARYSDTMRELIQGFKYRDRHEGRATGRRRPHLASAALPRAAVVAAVQSIGHALFGGRTAHRHSGRLLGAEAGTADLKPGRA